MTNEFLNDYDEKVIALAQHLGIDLEPEIDEDMDEEEKQGTIQGVIDELDSIVNTYDTTYSYYREEYIVCTDEEADNLMDDTLENYIDEVILPEIPEPYRNYFDNEAWKEDAKYEGRGHTLATYDGEENEEEVNGTTYYIYRTN